MSNYSKRIVSGVLLFILLSGVFIYTQLGQLNDKINVLKNQSSQQAESISTLEKNEKQDTHDLQRVRNVVRDYKDSIVRLFGEVDREKIKRRRGKNRWSLQVAEKNGRFFGTGWFIKKDRLITNYHVTDLMKDLHVQLPDGRKVEGEVIVSSQKYDLALIDPDLPEDYSAKPLKLSTEPFKRYTELINFGYPFKMNYFSFGSTLKKDSWGMKGRYMTIGEHPVYSCKLKSGPGASGSPVFNKDGEVVGIMEAGRRGFDNSLIIPTKYIQKLYDKLSNKGLKGQQNRLKRRIQYLENVIQKLAKRNQKLTKELKQLKEKLENKKD